MGAGLPVGPLGPAGVVVFDADVCGYRLDGALLHYVQVHDLGGGTATLEALGPGGWGPVVDVLTGKASFAEGALAAVVGAPSAVRVKFSGTGRASLVSRPAKGALWMAVHRASRRVVPPPCPTGLALAEFLIERSTQGVPAVLAVRAFEASGGDGAVPAVLAAGAFVHDGRSGAAPALEGVAAFEFKGVAGDTPQAFAAAAFAVDAAAGAIPAVAAEGDFEAEGTASAVPAVVAAGAFELDALTGAAVAALAEGDFVREGLTGAIPITEATSAFVFESAA